MGNRGAASGIDVDAFSRESRAMLRGSLRKIKRAFSKRQRRIGKREARDFQGRGQHGGQ